MSAATIWEISIKKAKGNLNVPKTLTGHLLDEDFVELAISIDHAENVTTLHLFHNDPFDRILISQAIVENLILISTDIKFTDYSVKIFDGYA